MLETIQQFDRDTMSFLQEKLTNESLQDIMVTITRLGDMGAIWLIPGIAMLVTDNRKKDGAQLLLCLGLCGAINSLLIKNIVDRARPFDMLHGLEVLIKRPSDFSFPSGHTASSFAAAYSLNKTFGKRVGIPAYALATAIGLTRIGVGVHYPSDVVVGAAVGTAVAMGVTRGMSAFMRLREKRKKRDKPLD